VELQSVSFYSGIPVTVVIPTLNEEDRLPDCLRSVRWAAEVIVADAGSTDGTVTIARHFGARVVEARGLTIAGQRNAAIALATQPWVLSLDADERATPELVDSIRTALAAPKADAYRIHFRNRYLGAPMERGGWGRDRHIRFSRASRFWKVQQVHEHLDHDGPVADLDGRIDHDSYRSLEHQLAKVANYSRWGADDLLRRGKRVGFWHLAIRPLWRFVKCYALQGAWREGKRGLVLSVVHAWSAFAKYAVLWDLQRQAADAARTAPVRASRAVDVVPSARELIAGGEHATSVA
jgi:glycosyltransferase involved in cell wall biosynthesis